VRCRTDGNPKGQMLTRRTRKTRRGGGHEVGLGFVCLGKRGVAARPVSGRAFPSHARTDGASWSAPGSFQRHGALRRGASSGRMIRSDRLPSSQDNPEGAGAISRKNRKETKAGDPCLSHRMPRFARPFSYFFVPFGELRQRSIPFLNHREHRGQAVMAEPRES
jgi:hypothetical protein